eukprot:TRINITY_DN17055_c0_g3_i1.p2 TRINITY_DN17055_c0_g3~~TRINITY_DN17055_c0_g3_i1.p2  ORF type:complete len:354 (+),score=85.84 TRINITY_DN17055_c0_g3_i1:225-1286(+)
MAILRLTRAFENGSDKFRIEEYIAHVANRTELRKQWEEGLFKRIAEYFGENGMSLTDAFGFFDSNRNGKIEFEEMVGAFSAMKVKLPRKELKAVFAVLDKDMSGTVSLEELEARMLPFEEGKKVSEDGKDKEERSEDKGEEVADESEHRKAEDKSEPKDTSEHKEVRNENESEDIIKDENEAEEVKDGSEHEDVKGEGESEDVRDDHEEVNGENESEKVKDENEHEQVKDEHEEPSDEAKDASNLNKTEGEPADSNAKEDQVDQSNANEEHKDDEGEEVEDPNELDQDEDLKKERTMTDTENPLLLDSLKPEAKQAAPQTENEQDSIEHVEYDEEAAENGDQSAPLDSLNDPQ